MRFWVIKMGEPLPIDGARYRPQRVGMLAESLVARGHTVIWWDSTLEHATKRLRFQKDTSLKLRDRFELRMLRSTTFKKNVSVRRLIDHAVAGARFRRLAEREPRPDAIVCCLPTLELSAAAVDFGRAHGVPVVLDVRDLWPDAFISVLPRRAHALARLVMHPYAKMAQRALSGCTGIVGISQGYQDWALRNAGRPAGPLDRILPLGYERPVQSDSQFADALSALQQIGVDPSMQICWFVGMFGRTYDLETVIDAARALEAGGRTDTQFVLSGAGETYASLARRAAGLKNVVFTGRIDAPKLASMGRIARVGLMAYAAGAPQGLPNKLFEYMCSGIPILSSLAGETCELLESERCGLSYDAASSESLTARLETLLDDPVRAAEMGARGRAVFDTRYSADVIYPAYCQYLEDVVGAAADSCGNQTVSRDGLRAA